MRKSFLLVLALLSANAFAADYVQGPRSSLAFAGKYQGEVFTGRFPAFTTRLAFDPARLDAARLDVTIPLAGAKSGNSDRDSTLQGKDFFNVAQYAQARYSANGFRALGNNQYAADGTLDMV